MSLMVDGKAQRIPPLKPGQTLESDDLEYVKIRFKDPVPINLLIAHITCMILGAAVCFRGFLAALFHPATMRLVTWMALPCRARWV